MPASHAPTRPDPTARGASLRRLSRALAVGVFVLGLFLLPVFLTGGWPAGLAAPTYVVLVAATVALGWPSIREGHPAVLASSLAVLAAGSAWGLSRGPPPDAIASIAQAWQQLVAGVGFQTWWPLAIAGPAGLTVLAGVLRGEGPLPVHEGTRGWLEGLPGHTDLFGLSAFGFGVAGTLFAGSTFVEKIAVVAPIFEEYAKLGLALLVLTALGLSSGASAYALGALSGLSFGLLEHAVTYSGETQLMFLVRGLFHALAAGLSGLVYVHLRNREDLAPGVGWFAIAPAALVHAANNVSALVVAIARAMRALPAGPVSESLSLVFVLTLVALALRTWLRPGRTVATIEAWWHRLNGEIDRPRVLPLDR